MGKCTEDNENQTFTVKEQIQKEKEDNQDEPYGAGSKMVALV